MNAEKWNIVKKLFAEAVELPPEKQSDFLQANCPDEETRLEVENLIAADAKAQTLSGLVIEAQKDFGEIEKIGNYQIIRKIGEGGMGVVYEAVREVEDFKQTVALKLLKKGMDSEAMLRRFRHERQILASLEHPQIARLLDGGMTADGLPFFAMEYVQGVPINEFCEDNNLSVNDRLRLFLQICAAVSFAHSRLVVHRDLKPSNILVTRDGSIKLLDFGIAKILSGDTNPEETITKLGMMTPAYASPEQIRGEIVTTASDVYSLGLILYELLTHAPAYEITGSNLGEIARVICEIEPPRPSSVVSSRWSDKNDNATERNKEQRTTDDGRKTNPKPKIQNPKSLRGDLDNIILLALRKEPARRYASVEQFAGDIKRHLDGLPITARPDTFSYRLEKFVARHRLTVAAGSLAVLTLVIGIIGIGWQYLRAESERQIAEKRFVEVRRIANNVIFKYYDAVADVQGTVKAREMMVTDATQYLDALTAESGASDDALRLELAQAYMRIGQVRGGGDLANVGKSQEAIENYRKAIPILEELNNKKPNDLPVVVQLVEVHKLLAVVILRTNIEEAKQHLQIAVKLAEDLAASDPANPRPKLLLANAYITSARALPRTTEPGGGVEAISRAVPILQTFLAENPNDEKALNQMWLAQNQLGVQYGIMADGINIKLEPDKKREVAGKAAAYFHEAAAISAKLMVSFPDSAIYQRDWTRSKANESAALSAGGQIDAALEIQREVLQIAIKRATADPENFDAQFHVYNIKSQIGETYEAGERFAEARAQFAENEQLLDKLIEKDSANAELQRKKYELLNHLGNCSKDQPENARAVFDRAYKFAQTASTTKDTPFVFYAEGLRHEMIGDTLFAQAKNSKKRTRFAEAKAEYEKALSILEKPEYTADKFGYSSGSLRTLKLKITDCENSFAVS